MSIVRGNDEIAYWLRQGDPHYSLEITAAVNLIPPLSYCPICIDRYMNDDMKLMYEHVRIVHEPYKRLREWAKTREEAVNLRMWAEIEDIDKEISEEEKQIERKKRHYNNAIAMLQQLVIIQTTKGHTKKHDVLARRWVAMYKLHSEFGLPIGLFARLIGKGISEAMCGSTNGMMIEKRDNMPQWILNMEWKNKW